MASPIFAQTSKDWGAAERAIHRLPPSSFPQLPEAVREALEQRGCTIPQTYFPGGPHNVAQGAFARPGQQDWAVLCSLKGRSTILVFWGGRVTPAELAPVEDAHFLQTIGEDRIGYSRSIGRADPRSIRHYAQQYDGPIPHRLDHDGIEDAFLEKASHIFYYQNGAWQELQGSD